MKLIILDRDGVINYDSDDYIKSVDEFVPIPGSLEAIVRLNRAGYHVYVATNQSGIARGYYDEATLQQMHDKLRELLAAQGGRVDGIVYCPHGPEDQCDCRKPLPGLLERIAHLSDHPLENVPVVGDSLRDIESARAVGATPYLVRTGKGERTLAKGEGLEGVPAYADLARFVDDFLTNEDG
ncbi:D-glycero-beta-D-manno-heptose 1,7-bisphosphate 7-phosphatase [Thiohalophilus thiocyanatoxydans]|uniref:D,D-heptose 1,7-bisphosphate phosphatase n=1 Tax=Thiohalophilus thiocyanatoxydans TaxID=381308 RepID=A0A4R8J0N2_9GAMM|nr:D-glycero-beta-D-manno-heptose 1,7-bisphosphate 7-phosphatase [Thiohalophilus thiocyanatoxydans]TDY03857.1 D-alpha,beta-D-heptose 1,7-bisphosphate phosphatase [Thiohalophilus thiocyanatoxydans]